MLGRNLRQKFDPPDVPGPKSGVPRPPEDNTKLRPTYRRHRAESHCQIWYVVDRRSHPQYGTKSANSCPALSRIDST